MNNSHITKIGVITNRSVSKNIKYLFLHSNNTMKRQDFIGSVVTQNTTKVVLQLQKFHEPLFSIFI